MTDSSQASAAKPFCGHCGHEMGHQHSHVRSFWEEVAELGFHFDFRHIKSLPWLLVPGGLARRYLGPERGRYSPPLKIYVFVCLLFFAFYFADSTFNVFRNENAGTIKIESGLDHPLTSDKKAQDANVLTVSLGKLGERLSIHSKEFQLDQEHLPAHLRKVFFIGLFMVFPILSALLLIIYRRQKLSFWDHMAFVLYAQTSVFLLLLYTHVVDTLSWRRLHWDNFTLLLGAGLFLYFSQKAFYRQPWKKTLVKYCILVMSYLASLATTMSLAFAVGIMLSIK